MRDASQSERLGEAATLIGHESARAFLSAQFGIESAFVKVSTLSKVLGLAPATIYASIRRGTFFIPHRMLGSAPAVKFEDLVAWYCADAIKEAGESRSAARGAPRGMRWDKSEMDTLIAEVHAKNGVQKPRGRAVRARP